MDNNLLTSANDVRHLHQNQRRGIKSATADLSVPRLFRIFIVCLLFSSRFLREFPEALPKDSRSAPEEIPKKVINNPEEYTGNNAPIN
jgi:hypothetical protein